MRTVSFLTAVSLPLFLIADIQAFIPVEGPVRYLVLVASGAALMCAAVWIDNRLEANKPPAGT